MGSILIAVFALQFLWYGKDRGMDTGEATKNRKQMDLKMQVKVSGEGSPVLLMPGGLTGWKSWEPFEKDFTGRQKKVIRVQLLNVQYGLEGRDLPPDYSVTLERQALTATLDSLEPGNPLDIIAWSYGALITLDYALDHPERIRSLVLIEPPAFWVLRENGHIDAETQQYMDRLSSFRGNITEEMLADFADLAGLVPAGQNKRELPFWEDWLTHRQSLRNNSSVLTHHDRLERLQNLSAPVLLIKGIGSSDYYHQIIDILAQRLPDADAIEMPGMHAPHIISKNEFLTTLDRFYRKAR
jgi:pimeloyl-ACP methyl ester carboxylesterase